MMFAAARTSHQSGLVSNLLLRWVYPARPRSVNQGGGVTISSDSGEARRLVGEYPLVETEGLVTMASQRFSKEYPNPS